MPYTKKAVHRIFIFLIFAATTSATYLLFTSRQNTVTPPATQHTNTSITTPAPQLIPAQLTAKPAANQPQITPPIQNTAPTDTIANQNIPTTQTITTIPVTITIEQSQYQISVPPQSTAYQIMEALRENKQVSFSTKKFSGLGYFIEEINGIQNNPRTGFYWTFYINNQEAKVGVSNYIAQASDTLSWKFESK